MTWGKTLQFNMDVLSGFCPCCCCICPGNGCRTYCGDFVSAEDTITEGGGAGGASAAGDKVKSLRFDFKGKDNTLYNLLSARKLAINSIYEHVDYNELGLKKRLVHGSYMTAAYTKTLTATGRIITIEFDATRAGKWPASSQPRRIVR